jgi:DNA polymerase
MDRHEAVLRELNMYPLWARREPVEQVVDEQHLAAQASAVRPEYVEGQETESVVRQAHHERTREQSEISRVRSDLSATILTTQANSLNWPELKSTVHSCQACALRAGCSQTVFGVGNEKADWLFIGEAPGEEEDAGGEPFVGAAGKLLDNMLLAIKLKRSNVYIANVIKCRPPEDRSPHVGEIAQCLPYLQRQIMLIQPKVIVALGKVASNALLGKDATLASLRGTPHSYQGIPLIVTYHPAYLLRSPAEKAKAWQDICLAQQMIRASS